MQTFRLQPLTQVWTFERRGLPRRDSQILERTDHQIALLLRPPDTLLGLRQMGYLAGVVLRIVQVGDACPYQGSQPLCHVVKSRPRYTIQGIAMLRLIGLVIAGLPCLAWFVDSPWNLAFGLLPPYWPAKAFWVANDHGMWWPYLLGGIVFSATVAWPLLRRFIAKNT